MLTLHPFNQPHNRPARCRRGCVRAKPARITLSWPPLRTAAASVDVRCRLSPDGGRCAVAGDLGGEAAAERTKRKAAQNTPLIRALGLAHYWQRLLDEGKFRSTTDIAAAEGIDVTQARRLSSHCSPIPMWRSISRACCAG